MIMFIHFCCLCPLSLAIKLNFNISKVVYYDARAQLLLCLSNLLFGGVLVADLVYLRFRVNLPDQFLLVQCASDGRSASSTPV